MLLSIPYEAVCCKIGPALWKTGSTDFAKVCKKDAFLSRLNLVQEET